MILLLLYFPHDRLTPLGWALVAAATVIGLTSAILYQILISELNRKLPPDEQFPRHFVVKSRYTGFFDHYKVHARLYPKSKLRLWMYVIVDGAMPAWFLVALIFHKNAFRWLVGDQAAPSISFVQGMFAAALGFLVLSASVFVHWKRERDAERHAPSDVRLIAFFLLLVAGFLAALGFWFLIAGE
jgi:hypothetical protein